MDCFLSTIKFLVNCNYLNLLSMDVTKLIVSSTTKACQTLTDVLVLSPTAPAVRNKLVDNFLAAIVAPEINDCTIDMPIESTKRTRRSIEA